MNTGERIREARIKAGLTQTELADKVGVKFSAIHKYESGKVVNLKRETIAALAEALDVKPSWLMCMEDEADDLTEELQILRDNPETRTLLHSGKGLTREQLAAVTALMKQMRGND